MRTRHHFADASEMVLPRKANMLADKIRATAADMRDLASEMTDHHHHEVRQHGLEMMAAARIADDWAREIEKLER